MHPAIEDPLSVQQPIGATARRTRQNGQAHRVGCVLQPDHQSAESYAGAEAVAGSSST